MVAVDPARLRDIATGIDRVVTALHEGLTAQAPTLALPAGAGNGWAATAAAGTAVGAWTSFESRLRASVSQLGGDVRRAADDYDSSDRRADTRIGGTRALAQ